jgi:hypothetical protein
MLKYPYDRHNGYIQLTDGFGNAYVPDFPDDRDRGSEQGNAMKYAGAYLVLAKRIAEMQKC